MFNLSNVYPENLSITSKCVIAFFPFFETAILVLSLLLLAIGISIVAWFSFVFPLTRAIYVFLTSWFFICSLILICALSFLAIIKRPDVSLSILWTIPGLISPPIPDKESLHLFIIAFTNVPSGLPFPGWTTNPFCLFTTKISLSS